MVCSETIIFDVPTTPPSVNHYKVPVKVRTSNGGMVTSYALTEEAKAFREWVCVKTRGKTLSPQTERERKRVRYQIVAAVFLGHRQRGDGDNFWKCIADSLVHAGVIHSDARVRRWLIEVEDGYRDNPHTLIAVSYCGRSRTLAERLKANFERKRKNGA